ncbi:MAG: tRNA isopentenyl-2-thiomethyl-A-37 hydroxylase MiaE [Luminiphilus sp.]|nr:tRNA isopentenyl-2-thiomethyl-A-37 hydroxylase MiaE [Luminiphilus sp.]
MRQQLEEIRGFLPCETPIAWVDVAACPEREALLLIDHANCEKKAAATALSLIHRYTADTILLNKMSRLAREELRHFEQVLKIMHERGVEYGPLGASRYAQGLHSGARRKEPGRLVDTLIIGAFIEARSCERFAQLYSRLDTQLGDFYHSLLKSEARHFMDYLSLAERHCDNSELEDRLAHFRALEVDLIERVDTCFRFHSGPLAVAA